MEEQQHNPANVAVPQATTAVPITTSSASTTPLAGSIARPASTGSQSSHRSTSPSATASVASQSSQSLQATSPASVTASPAAPSATTAAAAAPQDQNQLTQPQRTKSLSSKLWNKLWKVKALFYALVIVSLTDALTLTAPSTRSPLGSISYTKGVLVLSILQMLTGYSLAAAAQTAWESVQFRMLSKREGRGQSLLVFWTLSADVLGSCFILWRELCRVFRRVRRGNNQNTASQTQAGTQSHSRGHPKRWSIVRIISWAVIQFPGVIIMTIVNSTTSYVPINWTAISGGIGIYDPKLAVPDADPILITDSALNILQDNRRAVKIDPISSECIKAGSSCKSFLIPGGLGAVSPWPYQKLNDTSLDVYVTRGAPAYQIDFWDPPENVTIANDACSVYGASEDEGFQLCASSYPGGTGQIVARWTPCTATILPSGECSQNGSWGAYVFFSTILSIARRTATISMSRDTGAILAWDDLGTPELQNITAADFKTAFDVIIIPWSNSSSTTSPLASHGYLQLKSPVLFMSI